MNEFEAKFKEKIKLLNIPEFNLEALRTA